MARSRTRRGGAMKNRIANVRIVPEEEGARAMRLDRQLAAVKESQSQVRVVIKFSQGPGSSSGATVGATTFADVRADTEFQSLSNEYQSFRLSGFRFDIYDLNPNQLAYGFWGTFHGSGAFPTSSQVIDLADSQTVPPGTGKISLYWYPSGPVELGWYDTVGGDEPNYGGLAYSLGTVPSSGKYQIIVNAICDFRARR